MEENVGRTRQGRASRAHSYARKELVANVPPPKRGRRGRQGPPVRGTHDAEAGGSGGSRSRASPPVPDDDDDFDAGEYLNELADYDEEPEAPQQQPQHEPQQANVEEEGYPGGPHDLSLLKEYHNHRAIPIWDAEANDPMLNKYLRCIASANKVIKFQRPSPDVAWFWDTVRVSGLEPLVRSNFNMRRPDAAQMVSSFLGIDEADALTMFAALNGPHLKHSYVLGLVSHYHTAAERAASENKPYFEDLSSVHEWNWGSAALVHLQNYLDYASQAGSFQMAGYMSLLELAENVTYDMPLNAKYAPGQGHKDSCGYRQSLDNIQVSDCVFSPYDNRQHVRPLIDGIPRNLDMSAPPNMNVFEIDRVFAEEVDLRMIDEHMREALEEQPRPLELEVLIEESQERRDPNPLGVCRSVRDEVERTLAAGEAEEGTPVHGTLRRILNMLNPCLMYKRLSRGRRGGRRG
ncbi:hypothetical protein TSUD_27400 [Trifolium subterraneum]|uniref:Aminotransferase-like plant mobile domain-containing protein n=1 Tax=Trifolium subterraneum TaxID=3900 RepID=A0A2Z6MK50_TRISU|nr:hypothetical protein TSUD_27400 [Trifolium subterraneum]